MYSDADGCNLPTTDATVGFETPFSSLDIHELDITPDGLIIKDTTLETIDGYWPYKLESVPFKRLGSNRGLVDPNLLHVYRQLDQTTLSEDVYDGSAGSWSSSNFSIST